MNSHRAISRDWVSLPSSTLTSHPFNGEIYENSQQTSLSDLFFFFKEKTT